MVGVAQVVEPQVVALVVVGSSPITHPISACKKAFMIRSFSFTFRKGDDSNQRFTYTYFSVKIPARYKI
jgi:hypothetical protein